MGCIQSSKPTTPSSSSSGSTKKTVSNALKSDPNLQSFDTNLQYRTYRAINSLALEGEVWSLSLNSLKEVTTSLLDMNQEVVNILIDSKEDIWNNDELFVFVQDFFDLSLLTLDFCLRVVRVFLMRSFRAFSRGLCALGENVEETAEGNVVKKMRNVETWRRLCNVIFAVTFSTVLIYFVVAAAVSAPPLVTALDPAAAVPLGSMGKWVNSLWKKYETELKGQRELINAMRMGSFIVIKDLDNIKALVDKLRVEMEGLVRNAQFAISEEEEKAVGVAVGVWRGKWGPLMAESGESGGWEEEVWWSDGGGRGLDVLASAKRVEGSFKVPRAKVSSMMASMDEDFDVIVMFVNVAESITEEERFARYASTSHLERITPY
ncbi:UPF0496 protein-like protein [Tanacetum coccineum]